MIPAENVRVALRMVLVTGLMSVPVATCVKHVIWPQTGCVQLTAAVIVTFVCLFASMRIVRNVKIV